MTMGLSRAKRASDDVLRALLFAAFVVARIKGFCPHQHQHQKLEHGFWQGQQWRRMDRATVLHAAAASSSSGSNSRSNRRTLSAAAEERRDEERRRRERAPEVVPGKTSAVDGAKDFPLDVSSTEQEWMRQASATEQEVFRQTEIGLQMLNMLRLDEAGQAFDAVFEMKPDAYLWQAGIARFYLGDVSEAAAIFARCAEHYERRFVEPASEERIWRNACLLKTVSKLSRKELKQIEQQQQQQQQQQEEQGSSGSASGVDALLPKAPVVEDLPSERRKVFRIARDLFSSSVHKDHTGTILARAQLRSIGGAFADDNNISNTKRIQQLDKKLWKISSWYYLGLHYDVIGDVEESKKCMKRALRLSPNANGRDITHTLPMLHMTARDWFDDDEIDDCDDYNESAPKIAAKTRRKRKSSSKSAAADSPSQSFSSSFFNVSNLRSTIPVPDNVDPVLIDSILTSLSKMRFVDLQEALKVRGLRAIGSKEELQGRLFHSLLSDTGLMP